MSTEINTGLNIATTRIKNLRLRTFIGIKEEEINNKQDVIINIVFQANAQDAVDENDIENALNYRTICKAVIALVEGQGFALLEKMTFEVLTLVMNNAKVLSASVEIDKVGALRYSDSVSMTQFASRDSEGDDWRTRSSHTL